MCFPPQESRRKLNITWYNKHIEHIPNPIYLGVTLERTLSYKEHIHKLKCKTSARNNILRKLSNTKWRTNPATIKTTALVHYATLRRNMRVLCRKGHHVSKLDPALNEACSSITGCLRPTSADKVYVLAGIAPPGIRRTTTSRQERRQMISDIPYTVTSL